MTPPLCSKMFLQALTNFEINSLSFRIVSFFFLYFYAHTSDKILTHVHKCQGAFCVHTMEEMDRVIPKTLEKKNGCKWFYFLVQNFLHHAFSEGSQVTVPCDLTFEHNCFRQSHMGYFHTSEFVTYSEKSVTSSGV